MSLPDRHLDLGCGSVPRNPYRRSELCGVDIQLLELPGIDYRSANLSIEPIPFPDNHFQSVSAFDFIEHVPRILPLVDGSGTRFPFIELMNEVWRVLAPGGLFYAITPAFPDPDAFVDPTHVNIITDESHLYFCGDAPDGRMYGFRGHFEIVRVTRTERGAAYSALADSPLNHGRARLAARALRRWMRWLRGRAFTPRPPYMLWELRAVKRSA